MSTQYRACSAVTQTGPSPNEAWHDTSTSGGGHMMWPLLIKEPNVFPTPKLRAWRGQNGVFVRWFSSEEGRVGKEGVKTVRFSVDESQSKKKNDKYTGTEHKSRQKTTKHKR